MRPMNPKNMKKAIDLTAQTTQTKQIMDSLLYYLPQNYLLPVNVLTTVNTNSLQHKVVH